MSFPRLMMSAALAGGLACTAPVVLGRDVPIPFTSEAAVEVDAVDVEQVAELAAGVPLRFLVFGSPQAAAALRIDGAVRVVELRETEPGVYEGSHVIDRRDAIRPDSRVTATLQRGGQVAFATLEEPLTLERRTLTWGAGMETAPPVLPARPRSASPVPSPTPMDIQPCEDCARVESVQAVEAPRGGPIGSAARGVAQAILGKEAGEAHNRRMLNLLGAIGGALSGRPVEPHAAAALQYDVVLRLPDGSTILRRYEQAPPFVAGDTIRVGPRRSRGVPVPASL